MLVLAAALVMFAWGRWRYDVVAVMALLALVLTGAVAPGSAFVGFGHPAVITVGAVLILSRALTESGAVNLVGKYLNATNGKPTLQVGALMVLVVFCSAFMNNVGALALTLPLALQLCARSQRSPSELLMPLAFGSLLGGLITLIGTPPNVIIATYRRELTGEPFGMFDFAPVGFGVALVGLIFITLIGWRLVPTRRPSTGDSRMFEIDAYITEARLPAGNRFVGKTLRRLEQLGEGEVAVVALMRGDRRLLAPGPFELLKDDDELILEGHPDALESLVHSAELEIAGGRRSVSAENLSSDRVGLYEVVVVPGSRIEGRSAQSLQLHERYGVNLLAIARQGERVRQRLSRISFRAGDVLLLQGDSTVMPDTLAQLGCLPLAQRDIKLLTQRRMIPVLAIFGCAIAVTSLGLLRPEIAFLTAVVVMLATNCMALREAYGAIDGPIIVLLAAMIPVGQALEHTGVAAVLGNTLVSAAGDLPVWALMGVIMITTMTLSDVINNAATAVIMAPIAATVATGLGVNPDPFLMAVAVAASCAFLTPIGHQSNTLVMGPGGYRFADYWRMGLPMEILVLLCGLPLILYVWPL